MRVPLPVFVREQVPYRLRHRASWRAGTGELIGSFDLARGDRIDFCEDAVVVHRAHAEPRAFPYDAVSFGDIDVAGGKAHGRFMDLRFGGVIERFWIHEPGDAIAFAQLLTDIASKLLPRSV